ncbi:PEK protein kinase [Saprolegnia parasitica CBS 223.65]|uniref:non-specific serine/threonine protein kinase n=1 Tax=Saprolegnia parasitica (strain CBS 223.65) TaxID=695850 RepID=A0A067C1I8_SAPPC|nr:PEK protein kinase [Saprolegnia parasitica CBS 223.65]KDO24393.1 PEK protein kinase [Saprolegnia parasitica CBS 223.65]|eukprot:XP_012204985.1 PEK protein kinase [Saprolegnia parasitica CBS 223.65]
MRPSRLVWLVLAALLQRAACSLEAVDVRDRAILLAGHVSGQLVAFDAWTGEVINSIDSGGPLVTNCRPELLRGALHPRIPRSIGASSAAPATDVALASAWSAEHSFLPNLANGGLFHYEKRAQQWKQVELSTDELLQAKTPLRVRGSPDLADVVFVAEKSQKLFTFDTHTGQMHPFFSPDAPSVLLNDDDDDDRPARMLFGRVDVTTKMVNALDTTDFKCVTVSEYFVQFASHATCQRGPSPALRKSPYVDVSRSDAGTSLSIYDPHSHALLWSWDANGALTMVYGMLPHYGVKFYDWSLTHNDASYDEACPLNDDDDAITDLDNVCEPSPTKDDLVVGRVAGQMYLLPSSPPQRPTSTKSINYTGRRPWQSVVIDGKQGVFISSNSMLWICVVAVSAALGIALLMYYWRAKTPSPPSSPMAETPAPQPAPPRMSPKGSPTAAFLGSPTLFRMHTEDDVHLPSLVTMSPGRIQRSVSFGGFPLEPSKWKMPELKLGHRLSTEESEASQRSAQSDNSRPIGTPPTSSTSLTPMTPTLTPMTPTLTPMTPTLTTTVVLDADFRKVLPYICRGRFANEFDELSVLGKGGFGQVILAENRLDGRRYAVKRIGLCLKHQTKETLEKFLREVKILARLDHSYIVRYYQAWLEELDEADSVSFAASSEDASSPRWMSSTTDYSKGNILQRRFSSDDDDDSPTTRKRSKRTTFFHIGDDDDDDDDASRDSLFAPAPHLHDDDDGGFEWEASPDDDDDNNDASASMAQWSESDLTRPTHEPRSAVLDTLRSTTNERVDHWLYIQMQYCSAKSLADVLASTDRIVDVPHVLRVFSQIASALEHVHSLGLIHRDLKPANIFVMDEAVQTIKLGDFGLSRYAGSTGLPDATGSSTTTLLDEDDDDDDEKTAGVGTYLYASPEQISGELYSAKADLYSLGMILFELGHAPFGTAMERIVTLRQVRDGSIPPEWLPQSPEIVALVRRLVSLSPAERPTAKDVVQWCHAQTKAKRRFDANVHLLQVQATVMEDPTLYHNLLLALCEVIRATSANVCILACGLQQHSTRGQLLEFSLQADDDSTIDDVLNAIALVDGVASVEKLH